MTSLSRSRWAAVGAAVAVTLGGGGLIGVSAANTSSTLVPIAPVRVLDTRASDMVGDINDGASITVQITGSIATVSEGTKTVVPTGASAITGNMTLVSTTSNDYGGFATIYPCGTRPDASNINFTSGQTVANSVAVPLSASGTVCIYVYGTAHVLLDVSGYYTKSEISDLADRVTEIEDDTGIGDDAILYDADGVGWPIYLLTFGGFKKAKWSDAHGEVGHWVYSDGEFWRLSTADTIFPTTTVIAAYTSTDCSGTNYVGVAHEAAAIDGYLVYDSGYGYRELEIRVPLVVVGDANYNNLEADGEFRVVANYDDVIEATDVRSFKFGGTCRTSGYTGTSDLVGLDATELDLEIQGPLTVNPPS